MSDRASGRGGTRKTTTDQHRLKCHLLVLGAFVASAMSCEREDRVVDVQDSDSDLPLLTIPSGGSGDYSMSWVVHIGDEEMNWSPAASLDEEGSIYLGGFYSGVASLYDASGHPSMQLPHAGDGWSGWTGYLARYSPTGYPIWAIPLGSSPADDRVNDVVTTGDGVVVGGWFEGTMVLGSQPKQVALQSEGKRDGFVARYTDQGKLVWASSFGGPGDLDAFNKAVSLPGGRVAAAGIFRKSAVIGLGQTNETHLETGGEKEGIMLAVYSDVGELEWAQAVTWTENMAYADGITALPDGSLVIGGVFKGSTIVGYGHGNQTTLVAQGDSDQFLARYSGNGDLFWAAGLGIAGKSDWPGTGTRVTTWDSDIIAATGFCGGAPVGKEGEPEVMHWTAADACTPYVARYTADGQRVWSVAPGGGGALGHVFGLSVIPSGMIAVGGRYSGTAVFGMGEPNETALKAWGKDWFLALLDGDGFLEWVIANPGMSGRSWILSIDSDDRSIVASGGFFTLATFGTDPFDRVMLESKGEADGFLMRLDLPGVVPD